MENFRPAFPFLPGMTIVTLCTACFLERALCRDEELRVHIATEGDAIQLSWEGHEGSYLLQKSTGLKTGDWDNVGSVATLKSLTIPRPEDETFFRVQYFPGTNLTVFEGGNLEDLRAIQPDLKFGDLLITGVFSLPLLTETVRLEARSLTLASQATINFPQPNCAYFDTPNLEIVAEESIRIHGIIDLSGKPGSRTTTTDNCKKPGGGNAGNVTLMADSIEVTGRLSSNGGMGGSTVFLSGRAEGANGAAGGDIVLQGREITAIQGTIETRGGDGGGVGDLKGAKGPAGSVSVDAGERFTATDSHISTDGRIDLTSADRLVLESSEITSDNGSAFGAAAFEVISASNISSRGPLVIDAPSTRIYGRVEGNPVKWNAEGVTSDSEGPVIRILAPAAGDTLHLGESVTVEIQLTDAVSGVREFTISGLGIDVTAPAISEFQSYRIEFPGPPAELVVTAGDNAGNLSRAEVSPFTLEGDLRVPEGTVFLLRGNLDLGPTGVFDIQGTVQIDRGAHINVAAGSLTLGEEGRIVLSDDIPANPQLPTTLTLSLPGDALLQGSIDLSGYAGLNTTAERRLPEKGGTLLLDAENILFDASIVVRGGDGGPSDAFIFRTGQAGADAGFVRMRARNALSWLSEDAAIVANGGGASFDSLRVVPDGSDGVLWFRFREVLADENVTMMVNPLRDYFIEIAGIPIPLEEGAEPFNDQFFTATVIPLISPLDPPASLIAEHSIDGSIASGETSLTTIAYEDGTQKGLEDIFTIVIPESLPAPLETGFFLESLDGVDLDMVILDGSFELVSTDGVTAAPSERISAFALTGGTYYVGVIRAEDDGDTNARYRLKVVPSGDGAP